MVRQNDFTTDRIAEVIVNIDPSHPPVMEKCLSMTRSVCEKLEEAKIPYAVKSNGDLATLAEGLGKTHLFYIQRRIGLSRYTGYIQFPLLIERCIRQRRLGCTYIVITPELDPSFTAAVERLARYADHQPIILFGGENAS